MFTLNFLGIALADMMPFHIQVALIGAPIVRVVTLDPKRLQKLLELLKYNILALPKYIGQYFSRIMIYRVPKPSLV